MTLEEIAIFLDTRLKTLQEIKNLSSSVNRRTDEPDEISEKQLDTHKTLVQLLNFIQQ